MKILAFSDLHRDTEAATAILSASSGADIVVGAGDFATKGSGGHETLAILAQCRAPVIVIHGNHDAPEEIEHICNNAPNLHYLHGAQKTVRGISFFGLGGEIPSRNSFPWNASETEVNAAKMLTACPPNAVLITHTPPFGAADLQNNGIHEGSVSIRDAAENLAPLLLLCGHIHHAWGSHGKVASTPVHNLGPTINWFDV